MHAPTLAPKTMVCSPHALASAAGVDVLGAGGSAVDAAIATSAALSVLYPHMTGIGGDAFWLIHEAGTGEVRYLAGGGFASRSASLEWFESRSLKEVPLHGVLPATLTVPGSVDSWCVAHARYGKLPMARNLAQAVEYARDGFPVTARLAAFIEQRAAEKVFNDAAKAIFLPQGRPARAGERISNAGLATVLSRIAAAGREGFYGGDTARELAAFARTAGGFFD